MSRFAQFFSGLLHPLVMPLYATLLMLLATPLGLVLTNKAMFFLITIVFLSTCLLPLLFVIVLHKIGLISSLAMRKRKERIIPLLLGAFMCYVSYTLLLRIVRLHPLFPKIFFALAVFLLLLTLVTQFWKISLHMAAIGGLFAIVFIFSYHSWLLLLVVLLSGLLGTCRLWLRAHNSAQVYGGFCLGVCYFLGYFIS